MTPDAGLAVFDEQGLLGRDGGELAQLRAGKLDELRRGTRTAPALQQGQHGEKFGGRRGSEIQLHAQRHGIARGGGGEVGRQVEAEHGCGKENFRE